MLDSLFDVIWPRACALCRKGVDRPRRHICSDCLMRLELVPPTGLCRRCGRPAAGLDGEYLCETCRRVPPAFDRAAGVLRFEGVARELVNAFKFRARLELRDDFVDLLEAAARMRFRVEEIDAVVPMPSTVGHRFLRGYNPCAVLARPLARRLERPLKALLRRVGHPARQGGLSEEERKTNVVGTFALARAGEAFVRANEKATVLLLDDIMTTGSTLSEAAKTLKEAGVRRVWALALAHTERQV